MALEQQRASEVTMDNIGKYIPRINTKLLI